MTPASNSSSNPRRFSHDWIRLKSRAFLEPIARVLDRLRLTPNALTVIGLLLNVGVAVILAQGGIQIGGGLVMLSMGFDALDGTLARLTNRQSKFGAFFDSTLDRYSEAVVYGGLLYHFWEQGAQSEAFLVYAAIIGSLMVSYARARAEGLGLECKVGLATRVERVLILAIGLMLNRPAWGLALVALLANLTAVQRIVHVWRMTQN
jgi:CDP-diacylglycerol--glycerol-3-phosphate 3-phosphatidyltransferase